MRDNAICRIKSSAEIETRPRLSNFNGCEGAEVSRALASILRKQPGSEGKAPGLKEQSEPVVKWQKL